MGGKLLTNYLKEIISYRHFNLMDETYLINVIKEKLCYVSDDYIRDLRETKKRNNNIRKLYVLPDLATSVLGYVLEEEPKKSDDRQILPMNNERIAVPEILFRPSDIGMQQAGLAETIVNSISATPEELHPAFYGNILLIGGSTLFGGFKERLETELRQLAPIDISIGIHTPNDPILSSWKGGSVLATRPNFESLIVTKQQYQEYGAVLCKHKFGIL